jgi:competence protein ComEA
MKKLLLALASTFIFAIPAWAAVDINTASQEELEQVKGIGPKQAKAVVEYRNQHGPFKSTDELKNVPGFSKKSADKLDKLKKDITVGNETAAAAGKTADTKTVKESPEKSISVGNEKAAESGKVAEDKEVKEAKEKADKAAKEKGGKK